MKKILFPFQPGKENKEAFIYAVKSARNMNAELVMLNAFDVEVDESITKEKYALLLKENWMKAYASIANFNHHYVENYARVEGDLHIKTDYRFIHGKTSVEVFRILEQEEIDLLIVGFADLEFFQMRLSELMNHRVLKQTITSVLVIPEECCFKSIKNMVYATDFHRLNTGKFLINQAIKFARSFNAAIHFLHFSGCREGSIEDREGYELINDLVEKEKRNRFSVIGGKDIFTSMDQYISANAIDCIAVIKHHRGIFENLLHRSFTESFSTKTRIPMLVLIDKEV